MLRQPLARYVAAVVAGGIGCLAVLIAAGGLDLLDVGVLLPDVESAADAQAVPEVLKSALREPFVVDGLTLEMGASIGIACHPDHGDHVEVLIQRADIAMYSAKESGRGFALLAGRVRRPPAIGRRALVGCSEGELHSLGARMIAPLLAERGWTVLLLGADTPAAAWPQIVRSRRPDVAVLSTTMRGVLEHVGSSVRAIKTAQPNCRTVVGGQAYWEVSSAAADFGADSLLLDARTLHEQLQTPA